MRIYELARHLGVTSKDLTAELKRIRVAVNSASSSIEDKHVRKIMERFEKRRVEDVAQKETEEKEAARRRKLEEEERRKADEEERKRRAEEARRKQEEERRKREEEEVRRKREEEERRKREEEERLRREQEERKRAEEALRKPAKETREHIAAATAETPARPAAARRGKRTRRDADKPLELIDLPKIEVMRLDDPRKLYAERQRRRAKEKRKDRKGRPAAGVGETFTQRDQVVEARQRGARRIRPSFVMPRAPKHEAAQVAAPPPPKVVEPRVVTLRGEVTVGQLAEKFDVPAGDMIAKLLSLGEVRTINQVLEAENCELLAMEFGVALEIIPETDEYDLREYAVEDRAENLVRRSPVVTIMGHVDHGKTTLLDYIRSSHVVDSEYGGITQHIGAYRVSTPRGEITFLDTPGHEAFTSMRARGASVTDIVVLVVAADDGVMPQTVEAIDHARAANVPIVVAINKMDLPDAKADRVRQALMQYNLVSEALGGETIFCEVSAKIGRGVDQLLEMILLQSEVMELKADAQRRAEGVVIEARVDPTRGSVATLLVEKGTLRVGDMLVIGRQYGRVRAMLDERGRSVETVGPSRPVEVLGLGGSPEAGERFLVMPGERAARNVAATRDERRRQRLLGRLGPRHVTLENLHEMIEQGEIREFRLILKGDVQGSIEAISQALAKIPSERIKVRILHAAVGAVSESDVNLARASEAVIIAFNVRPDGAAQLLAERERVEIKTYKVIYELIDEVRRAMAASLAPDVREVPMGRAEVRQTFRVSKVGVVAGCYVAEGEVRRGANARLVRDGLIVYDGTVGSLRRVKDSVERVQNGLECGIALSNYQDIREGDILEVYTKEEVPVEL